MLRSLIAMTGLLAAGCVEIEEVAPALGYSPSAPDIVLTPSWAERAPTAQDILHVYPDAALRAEIASTVYLDCDVLETRALACGVAQETPPGHGFGAAALEVADLFVVKKDFPKAGPGARVRVPMRFVIGG